jgi:tRNA dimethylallyltransferase
VTENGIKLVCILGPTAAGKTRLAACLAAGIPGEVISVDSRQVYRHLNLGTGKDLADYVVDGQAVPYHLIDIVDPDHEYNVYEYKRDCVAAIREIHSRERMPVLCGGTGMYLSAILQDYELRSAPPDARRRAELASMSPDRLMVELLSRVPQHNSTDTCDQQRMIRAIEVAEASPEAHVPSVPIDARIYGVQWDREVLRGRITKRLTERLDQGLIEEIRSLLDRGLTPKQLKTYGLEYRHVTEYVCDEISRERMFEVLNRAIQKFAKRQRTWFRRMQRQGVSIEWLDGSLPPEENARQILLQLAHRES